jgi:multiple sugar transport system permease protein
LSRLGDFLDRKFGVIALLPAFLALAFVLIYPVVVSIGWSFTDFYLMQGSPHFVGLKNYIRLLHGSDNGLFVALRNGLVYTASTICLQILWGFVTALLLDLFLTRSVGKVFRLLFMIPWTFPVIVTSLTFGWILQDTGIISQTLFKMHLLKTPIAFLALKSSAMPSVISIHSWTGFPLMMMTILAGLQSIPNDQYEVAKLEGANLAHVLRYVIIPNVRRILQVIIVLRCVWIFNNFDLIFLLTGGGPGNSTLNLPILAYQYGWQSTQVGMSSAVSVFMLVIIFAAFLLYNWISSRFRSGEDNVL